MAKRKKTDRPAPPDPTPAEPNQLPAELALDDNPPPKPPGQALRDTQRDIEQQGQQVIDDYPSPASHAELAPGLAAVSITIPLAPEPSGYLQNHADFRLSRDQAVAMRRLRGALEQNGARVPMPGRGPRPVQSLADTFRWMAQQVVDLI